MRVSITGIGLVSCLGNNVPENYLSLLNSETGLRFSKNHNKYLGEVSLSNDDLYEELNIEKSYYSRTSLLAVKAAKEAWNNNTINPNIRTGVISASSLGGLDKMEEIYSSDFESQGVNVANKLIYENGESAELIARYLGISGFVDTVSTACSSGANAILYGARLLKSGKLDRVIVGGVDIIANFNVYGFSSLNIYSDEMCKPFDINRKGLNLGEGAGFLVLENEKSIEITGNSVFCEIKGWGNATDAYHQTSSSPDGKGAFLTMQKSLQMAGINPKEVDYINAHGTGTQNNDLSEYAAIKGIFGSKIPPYSSTKGYTGHTLAAAGAIEAVFCVLAIKNNVVWCNLNCKAPMNPESPPISHHLHAGIENVMSNSFGFGGNCTSLLFSRV